MKALVLKFIFLAFTLGVTTTGFAHSKSAQNFDLYFDVIETMEQNYQDWSIQSIEWTPNSVQVLASKKMGQQALFFLDCSHEPCLFSKDKRKGGAHYDAFSAHDWGKYFYESYKVVQRRVAPNPVKSVNYFWGSQIKDDLFFEFELTITDMNDNEREGKIAIVCHSHKGHGHGLWPQHNKREHDHDNIVCHTTQTNNLPNKPFE